MVKFIIPMLLLLAVLMGCSDQEAENSKKEPVRVTEPEEIERETDEVVDESSKEAVLPAEEEPVNVAAPLYTINEKNWAVKPIADANEQVVLLTFDDAPDHHALAIAQTLDGLGVKAIFFVNGHFLDTKEEAEVLREIHQLGFPIGNHTYSHSSLKEVSREEQYKEIVSLNDRVEEIIGVRPKFFRAPYGQNTDESKKIAMDEKMLIMNWSYGYDWEKQYQSKESLTDIMVNSPYLINGANLLMHDRPWTSEAVEGIVRGLQAKGYEIVDPAFIRTP